MLKFDRTLYRMYAMIALLLVTTACGDSKDDDDDDDNEGEWSETETSWGGGTGGGVWGDAGNGSSTGDGGSPEEEEEPSSGDDTAEDGFGGDEGTPDDDGSSEPDSGSPGGGDEATGGDGSEDGSPDDEEEPTPIDPDDCSHPFNPIDKTSWEKTYSAVFIGDSSAFGPAVAKEQGMGTGYTSSGVETFKTWDTLTTGTGKGWEGSVYHNCDNSDGTRLSVIEWNMMLTFDEIPGGSSSALMLLSSPRTYLVDESMIGTGYSWSFSYTLTWVDTSGGSGTGGSSLSITVPVSGSYTDMGLTEIRVMGEDMIAWHIRSEYDMGLTSIPSYPDLPTDTGLDDESGEPSASGGGAPPPLPDTGSPPDTASPEVGFTRDYPGRADYYWVEDLGLVYERHVDVMTEAIILEKTLTESVGL